MELRNFTYMQYRKWSYKQNAEWQKPETVLAQLNLLTISVKDKDSYDMVLGSQEWLPWKEMGGETDGCLDLECWLHGCALQMSIEAHSEVTCSFIVRECSASLVRSL